MRFVRAKRIRAAFQPSSVESPSKPTYENAPPHHPDHRLLNGDGMSDGGMGRWSRGQQRPDRFNYLPRAFTSMRTEGPIVVVMAMPFR